TSAWRQRRRDPRTPRHAIWLRHGANFMQCVARLGLAPPWSISGQRWRLSAKAKLRAKHRDVAYGRYWGQIGPSLSHGLRARSDTKVGGALRHTPYDAPGCSF